MGVLPTVAASERQGWPLLFQVSPEQPYKEIQVSTEETIEKEMSTTSRPIHGARS